MKKLLVLLGFALHAMAALACLNTFYDFNVDGQLREYNHPPEGVFSKNFDTELTAKKMGKLQAKLEKEGRYTLLSDYAVGLMKVGRAAEARDILQVLYQHYPLDYKLATNLGTAWELNGQVDSALYYIKRGIVLNPHDHLGSEWIHVKILETKQTLVNDPAYIQKHSVLQLTDKQKQDSDVYKQLLIQLQERVPFSPGTNNAIMASLFTDLGVLAEKAASLQHAVAYYMVAQKYYGDTTAVLKQKINAAAKAANKYTGTRKRPRPAGAEGDYAPLGVVGYKKIIADKNYGHVIKEGDVNTDVEALLKLVNFSLSYVYTKTPDSHTVPKPGEPALVVDSHDKSLQAEHLQNKIQSEEVKVGVPKHNSNTTIYIVVAVLLLITITSFVFIKKRH